MFGILKKMHAGIVRMQERRAAYWMLQNLSERELRDIGVTRGEILQAAGY
jgi:uncharacterized protein YjiS (DUF1127 family)